MTLLPWFFVYGISSLPFSHPSLFGRSDSEQGWKTRYERSYRADVAIAEDPKPAAEKVLRENGLEGAFWAQRDRDGNLRVDRFSFLASTRITYYPDQGRLRVEDRRARWNEVLTRLHARGGFEQPSILHFIWGVIVDIASIGMLLWVASGIYMWWGVRGHRGWGWLALGAGVLSFAAFLMTL
jgi:hypothetical protein